MPIDPTNRCSVPSAAVAGPTGASRARARLKRKEEDRGEEREGKRKKKKRGDAYKTETQI
jgi:hypothetical protein